MNNFVTNRAVRVCEIGMELWLSYFKGLKWQENSECACQKDPLLLITLQGN